MSDADRWVRWLGAAAVVGSALFLLSLALQAFVPQPDSYQFDPALTSPQFLREAVAPTLTVVALLTHLGALAGVRRRARATPDRERSLPARLGWGATTAGVALAIVGYGGLFTLGQGPGTGSVIAGAGFALLTLLAVAILGVGAGIWGVAHLVADGRRIERVWGALLLSVPVVGVVGTIADLGTFASAPYAIAFAVVGYDLWTRPAGA
ncbi:MAG: hypothetical protein ABEJ06_01490 [Haloarculaceae archaeon]